MQLVAVIAAALAAGSPAPVVAGVTPDGGSGSTMLAARDPLTLAPIGPALAVDEFHSGPSVSPDGKLAAIGMSSPPPPGVTAIGRVGLQIVDVVSMRVVHHVQTGIAAEDVAFVGPRRVAALLQGGAVVLVDARTGAISRRGAEPRGASGAAGDAAGHATGDATGRTAGGATGHAAAGLASGSDCFVHAATAPGVFAVAQSAGGGSGTAAVRLTVAGASGGLRSIALAGLRTRGCAEPAVAIDAAHRRILVATAGSTVAEVALGGVQLHARYHPLRGGRLAGTRTNATIWRGDLVVGARGAGVRVVDTATWKVRTLDRRADATTVAGGALYLFDGPTSRDLPRGAGLRIVRPGHPDRRRFGTTQVSAVDPAGGRLYARVGRALHVLEPATGDTLASPSLGAARLRLGD